jgi:hypothetical protein
MSTLWTPSGERPIRRDDSPPPSDAPDAADAADAPELSDEQIAQEMADAQRQLLAAPVSVVVANHCIGLFQLAALHLNQPQPDLEQASVAIDALAAIVDAIGPRLGDDENTLRDAVAQIRLAFVQVKGASGA